MIDYRAILFRHSAVVDLLKRPNPKGSYVDGKWILAQPIKHQVRLAILAESDNFRYDTTGRWKQGDRVVFFPVKLRLPTGDEVTIEQDDEIETGGRRYILKDLQGYGAVMKAQASLVTMG